MTDKPAADDTVAKPEAEAAVAPAPEMVPAEQVTAALGAAAEFKDKLLAELGFHTGIPNMNLAQRLVTSHLLQRTVGTLGGRCSPEIEPDQWDPPVAVGHRAFPAREQSLRRCTPQTERHSSHRARAHCTRQYHRMDSAPSLS